MSVNVFDELLRIKNFRENKAEIAVMHERTALREAERARQAAQDFLRRLMDEDVSIELRLYRELCERLVRLREIEDVRETVATMRQREAAQEDVVTEAQKTEAGAARKLESARIVHKEASRQKSKFVDLASSYAQIMLREAERKEDLEMEEAASVRRDREDWEQPADMENER